MYINTKDNIKTSNYRSTKNEIIKILLNRAKKICSGPKVLSVEKPRLNCFNNESTITRSIIPYPKGCLGKIRRIVRHYNLRKVFKSSNMLSSHRSKTKSMGRADTKNSINEICMKSVLLDFEKSITELIGRVQISFI